MATTEIADLSDLLAQKTTPRALRRALERDEDLAHLVRSAPPVEHAPSDEWFHEVARQVIQNGQQDLIVELVRKLPPVGVASTPAVATSPAPAPPPAIARRWLPLNADAKLKKTQTLEEFFGLPTPQTPHPDTLHTADLIQHRALVLLGESGAGKTHELAELKRMEVPLGAPLSLETGIIPAPHALREQLLAFCRTEPLSARRFIYLDALDEDKTEGQRLGDELAATLESLTLAERTNLWIRVTSRTASWPATLGHRLTTLLGPEAPLKVLVLQPLSEDEAALVAATEYRKAAPEEAAERGRAEVARARRLDMQALTMSPLTLKLLCAANLQKDAIVTRAQLFERGIQRLLKEPMPGDARDRQELKRKEALKHAAWFAALSTLASRSPIPLDDWPTGLDMDALAERLNEDKSTLRRVLTTPLFDDAPGTVYAARRFVHQSLAEWLAARWILTQGSTDASASDKWRARLTLPGGGVPPELAGVVSWLADMDERWRDHVLAEDIWLVITPDFPSYSPELRRTVFERLINVAKSGAEDNFYGKLHAHADALSLSGAEDTLCDAMARLTPQEANSTGLLIILVAMWTLISLNAGERASPGASALVDSLVRLGLDHDRVGYARSEIAVGALVFALSLTRDREPILCRSAPRWWDAAVSPLHKLLDQPTPPIELLEEDTMAYSGRLAYTLDLLYPRSLNEEKLFRTLHLPEGDIIGQYERFLRTDLPAISNTHTPLIPPLLRWWTEQMSRADHRELHRYGENAWAVAWEHREDESIWPALVENFYALLLKGVAPNGLTIDQHDRRRLLVALWNLHHRRTDTNETLYRRLQRYDWDRSKGGDLLTVQDVGWWVEQYGRGEAAMREEITTTINRAFMRNNPGALLELLHAVRQLAPEDQRSLGEQISAQLDLAELVERGEPIPAIVRPRDEEGEEHRRQQAAKRQAQREAFESAIPLSDPPYRAWRTICNVLMDGSNSPADVPKHGLLLGISPHHRSEVLQRAREFLEAKPQNIPDDMAVKHDKYSGYGLFAVAAVLALVQHAPSTDLGLSAAAWERWTLTLLQYACSDSEPVSELFGPSIVRVIPLPDSNLRRVFEELRRVQAKDAAAYLMRLVAFGRPEAIARALREALDDGIPEEAEGSILDALITHDNAAGDAAREAARRRLIENGEANKGRRHKAGLALWRSERLTEADRDMLLAWLDDSDSLEILGSEYHWPGSLRQLYRFSAPQLKELYAHICHHLPPPTPDPAEGEGNSGALLERKVDARSHLMNSVSNALSEQKSPAAADALDELGRDYNNAELIQRAALMRRELQRANWRPPSIEDLLVFAPRRS